MTFISRDGLNTVLVISNRIIYEKWLKLEETPNRRQAAVAYRYEVV